MHCAPIADAEHGCTGCRHSLLAPAALLAAGRPRHRAISRWVETLEEPLKTAADDFIHAVTTVAVTGQDVLDAIESRLKADDETS